MKVNKSFGIPAVALIIALVTSLFVTFGAIADDATPPPAETEESPLPPTVEPVPTDAPVEDQPIDATNPPLVSPTEVPAEEATVDSSTLLEQIPENTAVIVTSGTEIEPLATQEAANAFVVGDPIWCPENASSPVPGANGCTGSYATLSALITAVDNGDIPEPNDHGVIWILSGNDLSASFLSFDGSVFSNWKDYRLTLQGGWDGPGLGTTTGSSTFTSPIEIANWNNNVTINDIVVNGSNSTGLYVQTSGDVTLNDINSGGNLGAGAEVISNGNVTLTGVSQFIGNSDTGLYIAADSVVAAQNITANNNGAGNSYGYGAEFNAGTLNLFGTNVFNGNNESGLYAATNGDMTLSNITASGNGAGGGYGAGAELISSSGNVFLDGVNLFAGNLSEGLVVEAANGISISNTSIINNLDTGAYLASAGNVTLDCSQIVGNDGYGVDADTPNLVFNGVALAQNSDDDAINNGSISYHSNSCFSYSSGGNRGHKVDNVVPAELLPPTNKLNVVNGELAKLDCGAFSGAVVSLPDGDGAYLPCTLGEAVRLIDIGRDDIPGFLPRGYRYISSLDLTVMRDNQPLKPLGEAESVWYWSNITNQDGQKGTQVLYWDGENWVEVDGKDVSFMRVFFLVPGVVNADDLSILYWDGANWVKLRDNANLGSGRFVRKGGHWEGLYFEAEVNFIGTFVLAQK